MMKKVRYLMIVTVLLAVGCEKAERLSITIPDNPPEPEEVVYDKKLNPSSEYFVVFGDIQEYTATDRMMECYDKSVDWIFEQIEAGIKIRDILLVGDVTWSNAPGHWKRFYQSSYSIAEYVPYFVCTGNHDYDWDGNSKIQRRISTLINNYAHFASTDVNIVAYYNGTSLENYVARLGLEDDNLWLLVMEFGPRPDVVWWASEFIKSHPEKRFILMTHEWLTGDGKRISEDSYAEKHYAGFDEYSSPEYIWEMLVKRYDNIVCVLCGHNGFSARLYTDNNFGRPVPQLLFNLQYLDKGGSGLVELWEFPKDSHYVRIGVYDTINRDWHQLETTSASFPIRY